MGRGKGEQSRLYYFRSSEVDGHVNNEFSDSGRGAVTDLCMKAMILKEA